MENGNDEHSAAPHCYLPPHQFTYHLYGPFLGYSGSQEWNYDTRKPTKGFRELGRCDARKLRFRPREEGWAVMFFCEETDETFWIHVYDFGD